MAAQSEASTIADPSDGDGLDVLEMATAVLMRNFELLRRRSAVYKELDGSGLRSPREP